MKKLKGFLLCLLGCFMVVALSAGLFACSETGNQGNDGKDDGKTDKSTYRLSSISLDTGDAKTEYTIGDEFSAAGLKVTAGFVYDGGTASEDVTEDAVIDAANFNNKKTGTYAINIGYTFRGVTLYNNYRVNVTSDILGTIAGLELTYDGERQFAVPAKDAQTVPSIDLSKLTVNKITGTDASDTKSEALASGDYALSYSINGGQRAEVSSTSIPVTEAGTYSVFARAETSVGTENFTMEGFITFYAVDEVKSLAVSGGKTEFEYNTEETIGEDMTYTVTYASGATKVVPFGDASLTVEGIDNKATGTNTANVTYTETYLSFDSELGAAVSNTVTATATFEYKIGENPDAGQVVEEEIKVNISEVDKSQFADSNNIVEDIDLSGDGAIVATAAADSAIKITDNSKKIDGFEFTQRLQLNGKGSTESKSIKITTKGAATITVYGMSGSSNTVRPLALYDSNYSPMGQSFDNDGNAIAKFVYEVEEAGTYYLGSTSGFNIYYISFVQTYRAPATSTTEEIKVNISDIDKSQFADSNNIVEDIDLSGDGAIVATAAADSAIKITDNSKKIDGFEFTQRLQLNGKGSTESKSIKITTKGAATITVYGMSGSSNTVRPLALYDSNYSPMGQSFDNDGNAIAKFVYEVEEAGTYYLGSTSGFNIYYVGFVQTIAATVPQLEDVKVNISEIDKSQFADSNNIVEDIDLSGDGAIVATAAADGAIKITDNSKKIDGFEFTQRLQLNGKGSTESKSIKITTKGAATITVYGMSGSSNTVRPLALYDSNYSPMGQSFDNDGNAIAKFVYEVEEAGTYYLGSTSGFNIYYISIEY